jgi:hypothetical protein
MTTPWESTPPHSAAVGAERTAGTNKTTVPRGDATAATKPGSARGLRQASGDSVTHGYMQTRAKARMGMSAQTHGVGDIFSISFLSEKCRPNSSLRSSLGLSARVLWGRFHSR